MYRINKLTRPVLITVDEVVTKAVIEENADLRYLMNSIEIAEERYIAPALGDVFYEDFISRKNVEVTEDNQAALVISINNSLTAAGKNTITIADIPIGTWVNAIEECPENYRTLWNRFLWKITAEAVDIMAIVPSWLRTTAQGQTYNNPKTLTSENLGSASGERKDIEFKLDSMSQQRLFPLIARMKKWIQENGTFTLFVDPNKKEDGTTDRVGGIIFGLYDDDCRTKKVCTPTPAPVVPTSKIIRSITVFIKETPDPLILLRVAGTTTIAAQYPEGPTVVIPYLAGKPVIWPIYKNNEVIQVMPYDSSLGKFDNSGPGGFFDGDYITINFWDNA